MGIAEHVEHVMIFKILIDDTDKIIYYSNIRSVEDPDTPNPRLAIFDGEEPLTKFTRSDSDNNPNQTMMIIPIEDMIGYTFIGQPRDNGERRITTIVKSISNQDKDLKSNPECIKFLWSFNDDQYEEIYAYNDIIRYIEKDNNDPFFNKFKHIVAHEGPLERNHPNYKECPYNVMIDWKTEEISRELLPIIAADEPDICVIYATNKNLLESKEWKRFKGIEKIQNKF